MAGQSQIYSNELNAFRNGVNDRINDHKEKVDAVKQALGMKANKLLEHSKKLSESAGKLLESGVGGSVAGVPLSGAARKGITSFKKILSNRRVQATKILKEKGGKFLKAEKAAPEAEAPKAAPEENAEGGASQEVGGDSTNVQEQQTGRETKIEDEEGGAFDESNPTAQAQELDSNINKLRTGGLGGEGKPAQQRSYPDQEGGELDETIESKVDAPSEAVGNIADDAAKTSSSVVDDAAAVAGNVGEDAADAAGAAGAGLEEAAGATSFLAWLGIPEALAAAGAIAGAVSAGVGIADAVKGGDEFNKAESMPSAVHAQSAQLAGTYVVPTMDSVS